jgi:hypothetical protein
VAIESNECNFTADATLDNSSRNLIYSIISYCRGKENAFVLLAKYEQLNKVVIKSETGPLKLAGELQAAGILSAAKTGGNAARSYVNVKHRTVVA